MFKQILVTGAALFISCSAFSHQMVCHSSNLFEIKFDMHSGNGELSSGHGCHKHYTSMHCDRENNLSWICHDSCGGTKIKVKKACHGDCSGWTAKMRNLHLPSSAPVYMDCHEHMDNDW